MSWTCVGSIFRSPIKIFDNPIEPLSKVIFGPSLNVMQKKFFGSLMASFYAYGIASTNNNVMQKKKFKKLIHNFIAGRLSRKKTKKHSGSLIAPMTRIGAHSTWIK